MNPDFLIMDDKIRSWINDLTENKDIGQSAFRLALHLASVMRPEYYFDIATQEIQAKYACYVSYKDLSEKLKISKSQIGRGFRYLLTNDFLIMNKRGEYRIHNRFLI